MNRLTELGFIKVGTWTLFDSGIKFLLTDHQDEKKVLYSYVSADRIMYIGKTAQPLTRRLMGYQKPGSTQRTNIRVNKKILHLLKEGLPIDIYILTDPGLLQYGGFKISMAGGLEDALIDQFKPVWNISGKTNDSPTTPQHNKSRTNYKKSQDIDSNSFEVILTPTYYNQGFFNVRRKYSEKFGNDQELIKIQLGQDGSLCIDGVIDRRANQNGSPRILGRKPLKEWIKSTYRQGDILVVEIFSPTSIKLN
jgi:hypothetical protein